MDCGELCGLSEHEAGEGDTVHVGQGRGVSLVVAGEATEAGDPGEGALDHSAARQQHEALPGFRQLDHLQLDAVRLRRLCGASAGGALVDVGQGDAVSCGFLHGPREAPDLGTILGAGRGDVQRQQVAQRTLRPGAAWSRACVWRRHTRPARRFRGWSAACGCPGWRHSGWPCARPPAAERRAGRRPAPRSIRPPASAGPAGRPPPRVAGRWASTATAPRS